VQTEISAKGVILKTIDDSLNKSLSLALSKMGGAGYKICNRVSLQVDPSLRFMGYAKQDGKHHIIVMAEWALDSEMVEGFLLHELSHIYHTEKGTASHRSDVVHKVLDEIVMREGLTKKETQFLFDTFNHFQNIIVDDIVFEILDDERNIKQIQKFFAGWISDKPSGDCVLDTALLARNAFAVASLKRRNLYNGIEDELASKNKQFLSILGGRAEEDFNKVLYCLEHARCQDNSKEFCKFLSEYLEQIVSMMRRRQESWEDLK